MPLKELKSTETRLALEIPSASEHLEALLDRVMDFLASRDVEEDLSYNVQLLVSEAVVNAIEHGNKSNPELLVRLQIEMTPSRLHVEVRDEGEGFRRADISDPTDEDNLMKSGGRGLFLMESLADEVSFADEGRVIRMTFYRGK